MIDKNSNQSDQTRATLDWFASTCRTPFKTPQIASRVTHPSRSSPSALSSANHKGALTHPESPSIYLNTPTFSRRREMQGAEARSKGVNGRGIGVGSL